MATIAVPAPEPDARVTRAARGVMLGLMAGDALGASVEGYPPDEIRLLAQERFKSDFIEDFFPAVHMGTYVAGPQPATYVAALEADCPGSYVPTGPPRTEVSAAQCARSGMYSDDTNSCLALASSILDHGAVDAAHAAARYAAFWRGGDAVRGYPPSAKKAMQATLDGIHVDLVGLPPHFPYPGGSFANGGAMRISPLAIAYRNADKPSLRAAVTEAIRASHRHAEAIDFAVVQAAAVQYALGCLSLEEFDSAALLRDLAGRCETEAMRGMVGAVAAALASSDLKAELTFDAEWAMLAALVNGADYRRPGSGMGFQVASVHMCPCVLWTVARYSNRPAHALKFAIAIGGDTDTTASMVGAFMGALHGEAWCAEAWGARLENGERGRDYALRLGEELAGLDLR